MIPEVPENKRNKTVKMTEAGRAYCPARFFEPVREVLPGNCAGKANSRTIGPASSCRFYGGVMPSGPTVLYEKGTEIRLPKGRRRVEVEGIGRNSVRRRFPAALFAK